MSLAKLFILSLFSRGQHQTHSLHETMVKRPQQLDSAFVLELLEARMLLSTTPVPMEVTQSSANESIVTAVLLTTDKPDYAPGETAVITTSNATGDGLKFSVGELVRFQVSRTDGIADSPGSSPNKAPAGNTPWYVIDGVGGFTAHQQFDAKGQAIDRDGDGQADWIAPDNDLTVNDRISTTWFVEDQYLGSSLLLTATGQNSGAMATTAFTDAVSTTTTVSSSAPTTAYGTAVTVTATVTATSGSAAPTGTVQFFDGATSLGIDTTANSTGAGASTWSITTASLNAGAHTSIYAVYTPTIDFNGSTSGTITLTVNKADATITVAGYSGIYDGAAHGPTGTTVNLLGNSAPSPIPVGGWLLDVAADGITNNALYGNNGYRYINTLFSADQEAQVTMTAAPTTGSKHDVFIFLRTQSPNTTAWKSYYIAYQEAGATGTWLIGRYINGYLTTTLVSGIKLVAGDLIKASVVGDTVTASSFHGGVWKTEASYTMTGANIVSGPGYLGLEISGNSPEIKLTNFIGSGSTGGGTATGVLGESLGGLNVSGATHTNAGTYTDPWTFTDVTGNYNNASGTVTTNIAKAAALVTVTGYTGVYDGAAHGATGIATGLGGVNLSAGLTLGATFTNIPGGTATWTFTGGTNYQDQNGSVAIVITNPAATATTTTISSNANPSTYGTAVTFTATITAATGITAPTGTVEFFDGATSLGITSVANSTGVGTSTWSLTTAALTVGAHAAIRAVYTPIGNFNSSASANFTQTVNRKSLTGAFTAANKTYDGTTAATVLTRTLSGVLASDLANVTLTGGTATFINATAATGKTVTLTGATLTGAATGNYTLASVDTTAASIAKADATITVAGYSGVYDGAAHGPTGTTVNLLGNSAPSPIPVGGWLLDVAADGITNNALYGNNGYRYINTLFSADQEAQVTMTAAPTTGSKHFFFIFLRTQNPNTTNLNSYYIYYQEAGTNGTWGLGRLVNNNSLTVSSFTGTRLVAGDLIKASVVGDTVTASSFHGGVWKTEASYTMTGANIVSGPGYLGLEISGNSPEIKLTNFIGSGSTGGGTATGVLGESLGGLNVSGATHTNAGTYTDPWTFTDVTGNYNNASGTVTTNIAKAAALVTVTGYTGVYDGAAHGATGIATGLGGVNLSAGLTLGATFTNIPGGTATWTFTGGTNYQDQNGSVAIVITNPAATATTTTISSNANPSTYGTAVTFTATITAATGITAPTGTVEFFDGATSLGITSVANSTGVGTSTWSLTTAALTVGAHAAIRAVYTPIGNFNSSASANFTQTVNRKSLTGAFTAANKTYDGTTAATVLTRTLSGVLASDLANVTLTGGTATFINATAATGKTVTLTGATLTGAAAGNYTLASVDTTTATIATLGVTGNFTAANKIYDGTTAATVLTRTLSGVLASDLANATLTGGTATFSSAAVGTGKTVTLAGATLSGAAAGNYTLSVGTTTADIAKANATVTVTGYSGVYDGAAHGATGTAVGVLGEDLSAGLNLGATFTNIPGGTANWTFSGGTNYSDQSDSVAIVITDSFISTNTTISSSTNPSTYGTAVTFTATVTAATGTAAPTGTVEFFDGATSLGIDSIANSAGTGTASWSLTTASLMAGTHAAIRALYTPTGIFNGSTSANITQTVNQKSLTGSFTAANKTYDGSTTATVLTRTLFGVLAGDLATVSLIGGTATFNNPNAGTSKTVTLANATLTGTAANNYTLTSVGTTTADIAKAAATITGGYTGVYDGLAHTVTGTAKGVLGETLSGLIMSVTPHTNAGTYTDSWTFTDITGNYNNTSGAFISSIAKANATVSVNGYNGIYDGSAHVPTDTAAGLLTNAGSVTIQIGGWLLDVSPTNGITNNALYGNNGFRYVDTVYPADQEAQVTIANTPTTGSGHYFFIFLRTQNPNTSNLNAYYMYYQEAGSTGTWAIGRLINHNSLTVSYLSGTRLAAGDQVRATAVGNTVTVYSFHGGVWKTEISYTMTSGNVVSGPGYMGLEISGNSPEMRLTNLIGGGYTGVFGAAGHGATGTALGVLGERLSGLNLSSTAHTNAGTYTDTWTFIDVTGNYANASGIVNNNIAKAIATVTVSGYNVNYTGAAYTATGNVRSILGEFLSGLNLSGTTHTNIGSYTDTWIFNDVTGNYQNASGTVFDRII